jgi:hypothetical protein
LVILVSRMTSFLGKQHSRHTCKKQQDEVYSHAIEK